MFKLQQCLPFTVLKLKAAGWGDDDIALQQCLPFTVLKRALTSFITGS